MFAVSLTLPLEATSILSRPIKWWTKYEKIFRQRNHLLPRQRQGQVCVVVLQHEFPLCKTPLLNLTEKEVARYSVVVGAGVEHGRLEYDRFCSGNCCNVSANGGTSLQLCGVSEFSIKRLCHKIWANVDGALVSLEIHTSRVPDCSRRRSLKWQRLRRR